MSEVNLTSAVRTQLMSLQNTSKLLETTSTRLSTGKRVNSAIDNPTNYFAALSLTNRAGDLSARKDGIAMGISALENADKSLQAMTDLVEQAKSLATQAQEASSQVTTLSTNDISAGAADIGANVAGVADADAFTIKVGDANAVTITIADGDSATDVAAKIDAADSGINASYNTNTGKIEITASAGTEVTIAESTNTPAAGLGLTVGTTTFGSTGSGTDIATLQSNFEEIMDQIDALRTDASYKGNNLLNGDSLTVKFNEDGSSDLTVTGVTYNHTGLGFTAKASVDWTTAGNIDTALTEADAALDSIRSQTSTFGTNLAVLKLRDDFTSNMISTLEAGAGKLTDADMEAESARMLALQTRQSLAMQSLAFTNQAEQSILSLFR